MKLDMNIQHVTGHCCKDFQGQRSKVKVMDVQSVDAITAEAYISTVMLTCYATLDERHHVFGLFVRTSVRPLTPVSLDAISLQLVERF